LEEKLLNFNFNPLNVRLPSSLRNYSNRLVEIKRLTLRMRHPGFSFINIDGRIQHTRIMQE